jgi:hypothetical protein
MSGGEGNDSMLGNVGNDELDGGAGDDNILGGVGDDRIQDGAGNDGVDGGSGFDTILGALDNVKEVLDWGYEQLKDLAGTVWDTGKYIFSKVSDFVFNLGNELIGWLPGLGSIFSRHPTVPAVMINNKPVYLLELGNESGSRASFNFNVDGRDVGNYTCYILNVSDHDRNSMQFQRKGDKSWAPDTNRGPVFGHGSTVWLDGGGNYLAERGFGTGEVLGRNPRAAVLFLPQGLELESVLRALVYR